MDTITIRLLDEYNNPIILELPERKNYSFREIATYLPHNYPFEFLHLLDMKNDKIISNYQKLDFTGKIYKILYVQQLYDEFLQQRKQFKKKCELNSEIDTQEELNKSKYQMLKLQQDLYQKDKTINKLKSDLENQGIDLNNSAFKYNSECKGCQLYEVKVQRLVECEKNPLLKYINFAIEQIYQGKIQNQLQTYEWNKEQFSLYKIMVQLEAQKNYQVKINEIKEIEVEQFCTIKLFESFAGKICVKEFTAQTPSYDTIYLLKREDQEKIYAFRSVKIYPFDERFQEHTALSLSIGLRISQNFLNSFNEELKKCGMNAPEYLKFQEPVIITKQASFKQYFLKYAGSLQIFKKLEEYVLNLNDQESNRLYEDLKEQEDLKKIYFFSEKDLFWSKQKKDNLKQILRSSSENELEELKLYLSEIQNFSFPNKEYYAAYQIEKLDGVQMIKYDEDHLDNMKTKIGKFLQAFSYYTIVRSHRKLCVSRFKRVGNILYDPLISTYDGLLNKLDQGIHEIRQIESKFETAKPDDVDYSYLEKIGIKINRQQQFIQGQQKHK